MLLLEFLAVGTWGFWVLLALSAVVMSEMLDTDKPGYATVVALITVGSLSVLGNFNPFPWIRVHAVDTGIYFVAYFVIGTLWTVAKWYFWLTRSKRKIVEYLAENRSATAYDLRRAGLPHKFPPAVTDYKSRIIGWMMLWPASMI